MKTKILAAVSTLKVKAIPLMAGVTTAAALAVPTFAAEAPLPTLSITQEMLAPLVQGVVSNVGVILPVGLGLFAIFLGIKLIPRLIGSFVRT